MDEEMENICEKVNDLIYSLDQDGIPFEFIKYISACITDNTLCDLDGYRDFVKENC